MTTRSFIATTQSRPRLLAATALGTAFASSAATATVDANTPPPMPDMGIRELDSVEVNGYSFSEPASSKFTAPMLDTPRSISVLPEALIEDIGSNDLVDALRLIPGITFGAGEGGNPQGDRPYLRGFDAQGSIFVDGVRDAGAQSRETFDIEQIEVIKGSDSVYSGRSNGGGSINLVTKAPIAGFVHRDRGRHRQRRLSARHARQQHAPRRQHSVARQRPWPRLRRGRPRCGRQPPLRHRAVA